MECAALWGAFLFVGMGGSSSTFLPYGEASAKLDLQERSRLANLFNKQKQVSHLHPSLSLGTITPMRIKVQNISHSLSHSVLLVIFVIDRYEGSLGAYRPCDKEWIKARLLHHLKAQAQQQ